MSDEKRNDFRPAAMVLAIGLNVAAILWGVSHTHSAELEGWHVKETSVSAIRSLGIDGGTVLGPGTDGGSDTITTKIDFKYTATPPTDLPFKMAVGFSTPGPDGKNIPIMFTLVGDGFASMEECMSAKGVDSPKFKKFVKGFSKSLAKKSGVPITAAAGCVDARKFSVPANGVSPTPKPPNASPPIKGESL